MSVIVPARDVQDTVRDAVRALVVQDYDGPLEIVVVDNASADGTRAVVEELSGGPVPLRIVDEPVPGLNRARNAGVRAARGSCCLICDGDDVADAGWVSAMVIGLVDGDTVGGTLELQALNDDATRRRWGVGTTMVPDRIQYDFLRAPFGANCGFRREVWDRIGGFDERLTRGGDDFEFFWRAQLAGFSTAFVPDAVVHYRLRSSNRALFRRQYRFGLANVETYRIFKHAGMPGSPLAPALKAWAWLIVTSPRAAVDRDHRGAWLRTLAKRVGRLIGSIRFGVGYL